MAVPSVCGSGVTVSINAQWFIVLTNAIEKILKNFSFQCILHRLILKINVLFACGNTTADLKVSLKES